ncbi:MAG: hypothetical protein WA139_05430 [Candidatus Aenigmatarchaeota archaeon]
MFYNIKDGFLPEKEKKPLIDRLNSFDYTGFSNVLATHSGINEEYKTSSKIVGTITDKRFRMGSENPEQKFALFSKVLDSISTDKPMRAVAYGGAVKNPYVTGFEVKIVNNGNTVLKRGKRREPTFEPDIAEKGMLKQLNSLKKEIESNYKQNSMEIILVTAGELAAQANGTSRKLSLNYEDKLSAMARDYDIEVRDIGCFYKKKRKNIEKIEQEAKEETERWFSGLGMDVVQERKHAIKNIYPKEFRENGEEVDVDDAIKKYKLLHIIDEKIDVFDEWNNTIRLGLVKGNGNKSGRVDIWPIRKDSITSPWQGTGIEYRDKKGSNVIDVLTPERLQSGYAIDGKILRIGNELVI